MLTDFGRARRKFLAEATRAGHEMVNGVSPWADSPWDRDDSGVFRSDCALCDYAVQMFEEPVYKEGVKMWAVKTHHFKNVPGSQEDADSMPVKCEGRD